MFRRGVACALPRSTRRRRQRIQRPALGEWGVMWTFYLASYFVYSENVSTEKQEYVCIWNQGLDLVCYASQVSVVSSSIGECGRGKLAFSSANSTT